MVLMFTFCLSVCVCVWERERERLIGHLINRSGRLEFTLKTLVFCFMLEDASLIMLHLFPDFFFKSLNKFLSYHVFALHWDFCVTVMFRFFYQNQSLQFVYSLSLLSLFLNSHQWPVLTIWVISLKLSYGDSFVTF